MVKKCSVQWEASVINLFDHAGTTTINTFFCVADLNVTLAMTHLFHIVILVIIHLSNPSVFILPPWINYWGRDEV